MLRGPSAAYDANEVRDERKFRSTDVLTKTAQKVIPIKKITKLPSQIFTEPSDFPVLVPDEEVSLSVVIRSAVGIKSIKHTLCNKVLGDLKEYTTIPVSGNPLEMEFILKTVVDNKETNGMDGKKVHMVNTAESMNARLAERPVMAIATPIMDMIPAPMIWPMAMPISSFLPRVRLRSLVEEKVCCFSVDIKV